MFLDTLLGMDKDKLDAYQFMKEFTEDEAFELLQSSAEGNLVQGKKRIDTY